MRRGPLKRCRPIGQRAPLKRGRPINPRALWLRCGPIDHWVPPQRCRPTGPLVLMWHGRLRLRRIELGSRLLSRSQCQRGGTRRHRFRLSYRRLWVACGATGGVRGADVHNVRGPSLWTEMPSAVAAPFGMVTAALPWTDSRVHRCATWGGRRRVTPCRAPSAIAASLRPCCRATLCRAAERQ